MGDATQAEIDAQNQRIYKHLTGSAVGLVVLATVVYRLVEDWSWVDSFYFSVVAVTTVGFGDLSPTTDLSKLFTVFYILAGISLITTFLNVRLKQRVVNKHAND